LDKSQRVGGGRSYGLIGITELLLETVLNDIGFERSNHLSRKAAHIFAAV